jgi:hypothetical protein
MVFDKEDHGVVWKPIWQWKQQGGTPTMLEPEESWLNRILNRDVPEANRATAEIIEDKDIPASRQFRTAWKRGNGKVVVDLPKAKEIHKATIERKMNARMEKALYEEAWDGAKGASKKNSLKTLKARLASDIEAIMTIEDLTAYNPSELED